jgi:PKHD-type hydroxylase
MFAISLLSENDVTQIRSRLDKWEWRDGALTAQGSAESVKKNRQITNENKDANAVLNQIAHLLFTHSHIKARVFPRKILSPRFAKYSSGDTYGWHNDVAHMNGHRSDFSFTIFLSNPDSYDGGELVLDTGFGNKSIKGELGSAFIYETRYLHQVNPVTNGERLVVVGWIESLIRQQDARDSIYETNLILTGLRAWQTSNNIPADSEHVGYTDRLSRVMNKLTRTLS